MDFDDLGERLRHIAAVPERTGAIGAVPRPARSRPAVPDGPMLPRCRDFSLTRADRCSALVKHPFEPRTGDWPAVHRHAGWKGFSGAEGNRRQQATRETSGERECLLLMSGAVHPNAAAGAIGSPPPETRATHVKRSLIRTRQQVSRHSRRRRHASIGPRSFAGERS